MHGHAWNSVKKSNTKYQVTVNVVKVLDKMAYANSADLDQTAAKEQPDWVLQGSHITIYFVKLTHEKHTLLAIKE